MKLYKISQDPYMKSYILVFQEKYCENYCKICGEKTYTILCNPCLINNLKEILQNGPVKMKKSDNFIKLS